MQEKIPTQIYSEIGELEAVVIHTPGAEVENMTPENAERALYSDILNLNVAIEEYNQFKGVLQHFTRTLEVRDLLRDILKNEKVKESLVLKICKNEEAGCISPALVEMDEEQLSQSLIEGVPLQKNTLTNFLSKERFSLKPLHNFFFTRDGAISIYDNVFIGSMASSVRLRETMIMEAIFDFHPLFSTKTINPAVHKGADTGIAIEGGDVIVAREDILICGIGSRTTPQGIDYILKHLNAKNEKQHILVQELPYAPESFIHLDMIFTLLDRDVCMIYDPVIMKMNKYMTVHIYAEAGEVKTIREVENLPAGLRKLGMDMKPVLCGGPNDRWLQEREQWHSGANFFAVAPGKIIGYARNVNTAEALSNSGFEIIKATEILDGKIDPDQYKRCLITIEGSELPRGGGGARCMTMPVSRKLVE
ncbi:MAG: arginine deiminase [Bacteroidales bacterium]|nr:arginine deiminase [Bacteroidales bacterium]